MLIKRTNPVAEDAAIQKFQTWLHAELMATWGMDPEAEAENKLFEFYDRCYRNKTASGYRAEVYKTANEYKEVYWNDSLNAIAFFGTSGPETYKVDSVVNVHLIFFADVKKLKANADPAIAHRADAEVRKDVQLLAEKGMFGFRYISTELWLENVLKEYQGSYKSEQLVKVDMHPVHCFRLNFELHYNKDLCLITT